MKEYSQTLSYIIQLQSIVELPSSLDKGGIQNKCYGSLQLQSSIAIQLSIFNWYIRIFSSFDCQSLIAEMCAKLYPSRIRRWNGILRV